MKVVVDINLSPKWARRFQEGGYEAAHWSEIGPKNAPDRDIAAWARNEGWIVLTADLDFGEVLAKSAATRPSVVQLRSANLRVPVIGDRVVREMSTARVVLQAGAFMTFDGHRIRIRPLPLREDEKR